MSEFVPVKADIRPTGNFHSHWANFGKGGLHGVDTLNDMYNIPPQRRQLPMLCIVANRGGGQDGIYKLKTNPTTAKTTSDNWELITIGDSIGGGIKYIGNYTFGGSSNPVLQDAVGVNGEFYIAIGGGTINFGTTSTPINRTVTDKDWIIYDGVIWNIIEQNPAYDWDTLPSKPETFPSDPHTHIYSEITDAPNPDLKLDKTDVSAVIDDNSIGTNVPNISAVKNYVQESNSNITNDDLVADIKVGSLELLNTTVKTSIVDAINEVNAKEIPEGYTSTDFDSDFATKTTDEVAEGAVNLYSSTSEKTSWNGKLDKVLTVDTTLDTGNFPFKIKKQDLVQEFLLGAFFDPGTNFNGASVTPFLKPNGNIIYVGFLSSYMGTSTRCVELDQNGQLINDFTFEGGFNDYVWDLKIQSDGKIIFVGQFTSYRGVTCNYIVRLNEDYTLDTSFMLNIGTGFNGVTHKVVVQSDNKIGVGGVFNNLNGFSATKIIRLNSDGTRDGSFITVPFTTGNAQYIEIDGSGNYYVAIKGVYDIGAGNVDTKGMVKLLPDGSIDSSFTSRINSGSQHPFILLSDGKILITNITTYDNVAVNKIVKVNQDGTRDTITFSSGTGFSGGNPFIIQPIYTNKVLISGYFTNYNSSGISDVIILNEDGSVFSQFVIGTGFNSGINSVIQLQETVIFTGAFTDYNTVVVPKMVKLNYDGSVPQPEPNEITLENGVYKYKGLYEIDPKTLVPAEWVEDKIDEKIAEIVIPEGYNSTDFDANFSNKTPADLGAEPAITKNTGFNLPLGNTAETVVEGDDSRLSDQRTPVDGSVTSEKVVEGSYLPTTTDQANWNGKAEGNHTHAGVTSVDTNITLDNVFGKYYGGTTALTGDITVDMTGSVISGIALISHNSENTPTIINDAGTTLQYGSYVTGVLNEIIIVKSGLDRLTISYSQPTVNTANPPWTVDSVSTDYIWHKFDIATTNASPVTLSTDSLTTNSYSMINSVGSVARAVENTKECVYFNGASTLRTSIITDPFYTSSFSIFFQVKPADGNPASTGMIFNTQNQTNAGIARVTAFLGSTGLLTVIYTSNSVGKSAVTASPIFADGAQADFKNIDITFTSGDQIRIYVNNVIQTLDGTNNGSLAGIDMSLFVANDNTRLGCRKSGATNDLFFTGHIRNLIIQPVVHTNDDRTNLALL